MTTDPADSPRVNSVSTPGQRRRFAAAAVVFGLWVGFLAMLATRAEPPDPEPGANPGDAPAATPPGTVEDGADAPR